VTGKGLRRSVVEFRPTPRHQDPPAIPIASLVPRQAVPDRSGEHVPVDLGPLGYKFTVRGEPLPKERPRVLRGHTYTPRRTLEAERGVREAASLAGVRPRRGPVMLSVVFYRSTRRRVDLDNLVKLVQDALNGYAWEDDSQIEALSARKVLGWASPCTEIEITAYEAPEEAPF